MEIEFTSDMDLRPEELSRLEFHSILNILTVIRVTTELLASSAGSPHSSLGSLRRLDDFIDNLHEREAALRFLGRPEAFVTAVREDHLSLSSAHHETAELRMSLERVFELLVLRSRELCGRLAGGEWIEVDPETIERDLRQVLDAMAANSNGRYQIAYDESDWNEDAYLFRISVGTDGALLRIPGVFCDILRDLVANARKYSEPGSAIDVVLEKKAGVLTMEVRDEGRGIPVEEIEKVVEVGYRATNVGDKMGHGLGLAKAYVNAKRYGGRMWLESELGRGTIVRLEIPVNAADWVMGTDQSYSSFGTTR